ncbi:MAG: helix-turn-helix transcriptional regulator [Chloroflexota bacterium]
MINRRVGRVHRRLRQHARFTQKALSAKAGVGRWKIGRLEADVIGPLRFEEVERCLAALGAELEVRVIYRGAEADRLIDRVHSMVVARVVEVMRGILRMGRTRLLRHPGLAHRYSDLAGDRGQVRTRHC